MDRLKDFIQDNRQEFDSEAPSLKHEELFVAKLNQSKKQKKRGKRIILYPFAAGIAATMAILLALWKQPQPAASCTLNEGEKKALSYYASQLEQRIGEVEALSLQSDETVRVELFKELCELQADTASFFSELCSAEMPDDERINIIIQHYQAKIDALDLAIGSLGQAFNT